MKVDFIIIGAQRCGTTSLWNYLKEHPGISVPNKKELHYFDNRFDKDVSWYLKYFNNLEGITGEASPYYLMHPHCPRRIYEFDKSIKFIVLLRDPVDRAYSHYYHEVDMGKETRSFEEAIEKEQFSLRGEYNKMLKDLSYNSFYLNHSSYTERGKYAIQLKRWFGYFPKDQFLILKSESFFLSIKETMNKVFRFLGLDEFEIDNSKAFNNLDYCSMSDTVRNQLREFFKSYNTDLYNMIGMKF